jgi:hypothetical protein
MVIRTVDALLDAMANDASRIIIDKASISNTATGQFHSIWRGTGQPGQGAIPTAVAACDGTLTGAIQFRQQVAPATSYLALLEAMCTATSTTMEIHDRLAHMGGLVGNVATAQTVGLDLAALSGTANLAARIGDENYSDVQWWVEWYADTGATASNMTVNVTYNDGTTGNLSLFTLTATRRATLMVPLNGLIPPADSGKYIRGVNSITLSVSTGGAGNFGVTATRYRAAVFKPLASVRWTQEWASLGLPEIHNSSCLFAVQMAATTSTGTIRATGKIAHG